MLTLPLDSTMVLISVDEIRPQLKNRQTGEIAVDRDTNKPLATVNAVYTPAGGKPQVMQISVPQDSVDSNLPVGTPVHAVGLVFATGDKDGRTWQMFRAQGISSLITGTAKGKAE